MTLSTPADVRTIPVDHPDLGSGWWDTEHDAGRMGRWTTGDATVAIASISPCRFEVEVGGTMAYAVAAAPQEVLALCA